MELPICVNCRKRVNYKVTDALHRVCFYSPAYDLPVIFCVSLPHAYCTECGEEIWVQEVEEEALNLYQEAIDNWRNSNVN